MTETTPISNTVRRAGGVIIAMVALIAAVPAEVRTASGAGGHGDSGNEWVEGEETGARQLPKITVTATRDTIFAGLDTVSFILTREQPASSPLDVTLRFTQEQDWLSSTSYQVSFAANSTTADLFLGRSSLSTEVTESGFLTASVDSVGGYDTSEATASVYVISRDGPVVTVSLTDSSYTFRESSGDTALIVTAQMAAGMPRGVEFRFSIQHQDRTSSRPDLTAVSGQDYLAFARELSFLQADYALENGRWVARKSFSVTLLDDDVREGTENFEALLGAATGFASAPIQRLNPDGSACNQNSCPYPVYITDDEDIPELDLSVSPVEIREEDEESSTATVSITNGKTFAADQVVTFTLAGTATAGTDYTVAPADGDGMTTGHQATLLADSSSVDLTLTAMDDVIPEPNETINVSATLDGTAIGSTQTIRVLNRGVLPKITVTATRDTIFAGLEPVTLTLTREMPVNSPLDVTLRFTQEEDWLSSTSSRVSFAADSTTAELFLGRSSFSTEVTESGSVTAAVDAVDGYDTREATASVYVISREEPVVTVSLTDSSYTFREASGDTALIVTAQMASGMPRGVGFRVSIQGAGRSSSRPDLTAVSSQDYLHFRGLVEFARENFALENGRWVARKSVPVTLLDDDVREGTENLEAQLQRDPEYIPALVQRLNPDGSDCNEMTCPYPVYITDDEDIPELDLSVSPVEIREEDEESSTATVSITNGKTFATDQVVTFSLGGTATAGTDYTVAPADEDGMTTGHQATLPAGSASVGVTLTAMNDNVEDSNETIEVSATHDGVAVGSTQTIRILNQEVLPRITLAANRDTIIGSMETLVLTLTREAPLDESLTVTVQLTQDRNWLSNRSRQVTFDADSASAALSIRHGQFSASVTQSGNLTATVDSVDGYDTGAASAEVFVVSQSGPAVTVSFSAGEYGFAEDGDSAGVILVAKAASGMPRGTTVGFGLVSNAGTAISPDDFTPVSELIRVPEADYALEDGSWTARYRLPLTLQNDDVREGAERFRLVLEGRPGIQADLKFTDPEGADCTGSCVATVEITDDEDIPAFALSLSEDEIREKGETSSMATVSITNGKTFATDRMVTFELGGDAIPSHDYAVTPADADEGTGHQAILPAGSSSAEVTFTAIDDNREEGDEEIRLRATHDGDEIGSGTIRLVDRTPGPRVEITFEGVQPPRDDYTAGVATGPFTARFTFSERVEGFTEDDIEWDTHALTTIDSTSIGVKLWDYTVVREGLEYTARMMPDQNGRLWVGVDPGAVRSVGTGEGNRLGLNSLWIELPPNRLMVEPRTLTVDEGDADGGWFLVLLTSKPTGTVTVTVSGMDGTVLKVDRPTVKFTLPYWNGGWGIRVTAAHDTDTANEQVRLWVKASGGGYDGRGADIVVNIRDDDGSGGDVGDGEADEQAAALSLLEGMTAEAAAAALFGEGDLSAAQLAALDLLGNRNGKYDLGDLLSWTARCKRGEVRCGDDPSPASNPIAGAALGLVAGRRYGRSGHRGSPGGCMHRLMGRVRRRLAARRRRTRSRAAWSGFPLLLAAVLASACTDDVLQPPLEADPGYLTVRLASPSDARDIGAMLVVEGPGIEAVRASGFQLFESEASSPTRREIIVSGTLTTGPVLEFHVPDRHRQAEYRVRVLEVAAEDYTLRDPATYSARISR